MTQSLQLPAAYHCNLRCADCSHLANYAAPRLLTPEGLAADLRVLAQVLHTRQVDLMGGEPLLNPRLAELAQVVRSSGIADWISVSTNGLLLRRMDEAIWAHVDEVRVTVYPDAPPPPEAIAAAREQAAAAGRRLKVRHQETFRACPVTAPHPLDLTTRLIYHSCTNVHVRQSHMLSDGRFYKCPVPVCLPDYQRRLGHEGYDPAADGVALHTGDDLGGELRRYLRQSRPLQACRYCLGSAGVKREHRRLGREERQDPAVSPVSRRQHLDRGHLARRLARRAYWQVLGWLGVQWRDHL